MTADRRRERGFALLIVLWTMVLLAVIAAGLAAAGHTEVKLAQNLRDAAIAQAAADGATHDAIFQVAAGTWQPGPLPHVVRLGEAVVDVSIMDTDHLINPNLAPPDLLAALLQEAGADPGTAQAVAGLIDEYHNRARYDPSAYIAAGLPYGPGRRDFRNVDELRLIPGMTAALYARIAPHLSVASLGFVVPDAADPVVAVACQAAAQSSPDVCSPPSADEMKYLRNTLLARITATAIAGTARFTRIADVYFPGEAGGGAQPPYRIMAWQRPGA